MTTKKAADSRAGLHRPTLMLGISIVTSLAVAGIVLAFSSQESPAFTALSILAGASVITGTLVGVILGDRDDPFAHIASALARATIAGGYIALGLAIGGSALLTATRGDVGEPPAPWWQAAAPTVFLLAVGL